MDNLLNRLKEQANSHHTRVVAFAILGAVIGATLTFLALPNESIAPAVTEIQPTSTSTAEVIEVADPVHIRIPSAHIDADFVGPLGLNDDQTVEVPDSFEEVGWYKYGPRPGELGPAVVLGHVDSYQGPAVFYSLGQAKVGDTIEIDRADGTTAVFEVIKSQRYPQSDFPTAEVYGDLDYPGLRVITCTGTYDHGSLRYSHNLVVYAKLIEEIPASE